METQIPPTPPNLPPIPPVVTGWLTGKVIAIIVAVLIASGAGGYFIYSNKNNPTNLTQNSGNTAQQNKLNQDTDHPLIMAQCDSFLTLGQYADLRGVPESSLQKKKIIANYRTDDNLICDFGGVEIDISTNRKNRDPASIRKDLLGCGLLYKEEDCKTTSGNPDIYSVTLLNYSGGTKGGVVQAASNAGPFDIACTYSELSVYLGDKGSSENEKTASSIKCIKYIQQNYSDNKISLNNRIASSISYPSPNFSCDDLFNSNNFESILGHSTKWKQRGDVYYDEIKCDAGEFYLYLWWNNPSMTQVSVEEYWTRDKNSLYARETKKDVSSLGSKAFATDEELEVLSSNKKYALTIRPGYSEFYPYKQLDFDLDKLTKIAKAIDSNLNKY